MGILNPHGPFQGHPRTVLSERKKTCFHYSAGSVLLDFSNILPDSRDAPLAVLRKRVDLDVQIYTNGHIGIKRNNRPNSA